MMLSDEEIIAMRKANKGDCETPWSDSIAFARAVERAVIERCAEVCEARHIAEIEELRREIDNIKQVEFPKRAQAVADAWRGKCERLESEVAALRE